MAMMMGVRVCVDGSDIALMFVMPWFLDDV